MVGENSAAIFVWTRCLLSERQLYWQTVCLSLCEFLVRNRSIVVFSVSELLLFVSPIRLFLSDKNVPRQIVSSKTQDKVSEDLLSENEDLLSSAGPSRTSTPFSSASLFSGTSNSSVSTEMEEYKDVSEKPEQNKTSEQPGTFEQPVEEEDIGNISSLIASSMNTVSGYFEDL
ncbi:hypothetical protein J6590_023577 [Homalodisca vitripennis]|nr:hypothetical protein J6590_023577 [Homalodisca vitripennis]